RSGARAVERLRARVAAGGVPAARARGEGGGRAGGGVRRGRHPRADRAPGERRPRGARERLRARRLDRSAVRRPRAQVTACGSRAEARPRGLSARGPGRGARARLRTGALAPPPEATYSEVMTELDRT